MNTFPNPQMIFCHCVMITMIMSFNGCATMGAKLAEREVIQMASAGCAQTGAVGPVTYEECQLATRIIKDWGIREGLVGFDDKGRLELRGTYQTEDDVDRAFVAAQTIVGVSNVSPVTPRNINVLKWHSVASNADVNQRNSSAAQNKKYALIVGVSNFSSGKISKIATARNDASLLEAALKNFGFDEIKLLLDGAATRTNIIQSIDQLRHKAAPGDTILVYFSSHGAPPDKYGQLNIVPYDFSSDMLSVANKWDPSKPHTDTEYLEIAKIRYETQSKYGVPTQLVHDLIAQSKAESVIGILDICYSGAAMDNLFKPLGSSAMQAEKGDVSYSINDLQIAKTLGYSDSKDLVQESSIPSSDIPSEIPSIGNFDFNEFGVPHLRSDITVGSGKALITASSGKEKSRYDGSPGFSRTGINTSYFTHYFVDGLNKTQGQTRLAFEYALPRTQKIVKSLLGVSQTPKYQTNPDDNKLSISLIN